MKRVRDYARENLPRDLLGVTATLRERQSNERLARVFPDVGAVASYCDTAHGDWRVLSLSSWRTIVRDLSASRYQPCDDDSLPTVLMPERSMLGEIGRADLLDDSFTRTLDDERERRR